MREIPLCQIQNHFLYHVADTWVWEHTVASRTNPQRFKMQATCCLQDQRHMSLRQRFRRYLQHGPPTSIHGVFQSFAKLAVLCKTHSKTLLYSVPCKWYVGKTVPRQGQRLQNAEDESKPFVVPPKGRTQGKCKTQQHQDSCNQTRRLKHSLQLCHWSHEEDSAPKRCDVTKGIKHCEQI